MKKYKVTLQRRAGSVLEFVALSDIALAAFELMPLAEKIRVVEETYSHIVISYEWKSGEWPELLTDEEFSRFGLTCVKSEDPRVRHTADPRRTSPTFPTTNLQRRVQDFDPSPMDGQRQRFVDMEAVRAFWAEHTRVLPRAHLLNAEEFAAAIAIGVESILRNARPSTIQLELKSCYDRMLGKSIASWEHVLDIAEFVYKHADLRLPADSLANDRRQTRL